MLCLAKDQRVDYKNAQDEGAINTLLSIGQMYFRVKPLALGGLAEIMFTNIFVRWTYGLKRDLGIFATDSYKHELKDQTVK